MFDNTKRKAFPFTVSVKGARRFVYRLWCWWCSNEWWDDCWQPSPFSPVYWAAPSISARVVSVQRLEIGEESPDTNQTGAEWPVPGIGWCAQGPAEGPCSLLTVTQRDWRNSDTALAFQIQSVTSKKNVTDRIRIIECSWSYLKFNPLAWFPIPIVSLFRIRLEFCRKDQNRNWNNGAIYLWFVRSAISRQNIGNKNAIELTKYQKYICSTLSSVT